MRAEFAGRRMDLAGYLASLYDRMRADLRGTLSPGAIYQRMFGWFRAPGHESGPR